MDSNAINNAIMSIDHEIKRLTQARTTLLELVPELTKRIEPAQVEINHTANLPRAGTQMMQALLSLPRDRRWAGSRMLKPRVDGGRMSRFADLTYRGLAEWRRNPNGGGRQYRLAPGVAVLLEAFDPAAGPE